MRLHLPSPLQQARFDGLSLYIKRDDLIDPDFSGNKARKFAWLLEAPLPHIREIISHGSAQSNAMYSLSVLARMRGWRFRYYVDHIAGYLRSHPHGNYLAALQNGMQIVEGKPPEETREDQLMIEEGGRRREAAEGIRALAEELKIQLKGEAVDIFLPSGTGTTAFYLQQYLPWRVYTTPCVGDAAYLQRQFTTLATDRSRMPMILESEKKYHFGKLYREFFKIWVELRDQTDIEFDLLYDPKGWITLLANRSRFAHRICYIHQGGIRGNESMLKRYKRKYG